MSFSKYANQRLQNLRTIQRSFGVIGLRELSWLRFPEIGGIKIDGVWTEGVLPVLINLPHRRPLACGRDAHPHPLKYVQSRGHVSSVCSLPPLHTSALQGSRRYGVEGVSRHPLPGALLRQVADGTRPTWHATKLFTGAATAPQR